MKNILLFIFISISFLQDFDELYFGTDDALDIMTWNIEWFPKNGEITVNYVTQIIDALDIDVLAKALKGYEQATVDHILSFLPTRKQKMYTPITTPLSKKDAEQAQQSVVQLAKDLGKSVEKKKKIKKKDFNYIIKIADFYFENSAIDMKKRIFNQTSIKNIRVKKLSDTKFRVFIGPYDNLNSLKKSFNAIKTLEFDNIEIIKN